MRGSVREIFAFLGLIAAVWTAVVVSRWVGAHWFGARPAFVFLMLRWMVAGLAALAAGTLLVWWGELLAGAVRESPVGWLDRFSGFFVGASFGAIVVAFVLMIVVLTPWPRTAGAWARSARVSRPVLSGAVRLCDLGDRYVPAGNWLRERFLSAERRIRAGGIPS